MNKLQALILCLALTPLAYASCLEEGIQAMKQLGQECNNDCIASFENYGCHKSEEYGRFNAIGSRNDVEVQEIQNNPPGQSLTIQAIATELSEINIQLQRQNDILWTDQFGH